MSAVVATAILCLTLGYYAGQGGSLCWVSSWSSAKRRRHTHLSDESCSSGEDAEIEEQQAQLNKLAAQEDCKMVFIVRTDLEMGKGKIAAQCCHAAVKNVQSIQRTNPFLLRKWESSGQAKIVLKCGSEEEMLRLQWIAREGNLCANSIQDAGHTQIAAGSRTVLAIGPGPKSSIDKVAGHLKLL